MQSGVPPMLHRRPDSSALLSASSLMGQSLFYPPSVKGWDGGRSWINASTVLARANLISDIATSGETKFQKGSLTEWAKSDLETAGHAVHIHRDVPPNDGGLALGKLAHAAFAGTEEIG